MSPKIRHLFIMSEQRPDEYIPFCTKDVQVVAYIQDFLCWVIRTEPVLPGKGPVRCIMV